MPSFFDLEESKKKVVLTFFSFLLFLYFLTFYLIGTIIKLEITETFSFLSLSQTGLLIFISAVGSYLHIRFSTKNISEKIISSLGAKTPDEEDHFHHQLKNVIDEILVSAGGITTETYIIPTHSMNAFSLSDMRGRNIVGVTEGLLSNLSRNQLQGVVAHEIGHIINGDAFLTTVASSLFDIYNFFLDTFRQTKRISPPLILIFILLSGMRFLSKLVNFFISRQREYQADATAVRLTRYPQALTEALYVISRHSYSFSPTVRNFENIFIVNPKNNIIDEKEGIIAYLFSTHPPIKKRINTLLNISHSNFLNMVEKIDKEKNIKRESPPVYSLNKIYYACNPQSDWVGPLSREGLTLLPFFSPSLLIYNTTLKRGIYPAAEDKNLSTLFQKNKNACPSCQVNLIESYYEGAKILTCSSCEGYFLGKEKVMRILSRKISDFSPEVKREGEIIKEDIKKSKCSVRNINTPFTLSCPQCTLRMKHMFYNYVWPVEVDKCLTCQGIWLGKKEMELIQYLFETRGN